MSAAAKTFSKKLLAWFDQHGRKNLPWQKKLSDKKTAPYRVWLSEIMLQQTQVSTVIPYYEKFLQEFPTVEDLARAPLDEVLHLWSGLGYYARARHLHATAQHIVQRHQGQFPDNVDALSQLPGIGRSTAGAIVSIAFKKRAAILDGNVKRVLARHFALAGAPSTREVEKKFWALAESLTPSARVHHYSQAIMDLGATLCTRSQPRCQDCPLRRSCVACQTDSQARYPEKPAGGKKNPLRETRMLLVINPAQHVYLQKRPLRGIWGGLWSLPELPLEEDPRQWCRQTFGVAVKQSRPLDAFVHTFSHYRLRIHPLIMELGKTAKETRVEDSAREQLWYNFNNHRQPLRKGLAAPVSALLKQL